MATSHSGKAANSTIFIKEKMKMGKEIERKFLLKGDSWRSLAKGTKYRQGYLNSAKERIVRIRTIDDKGF